MCKPSDIWVLSPDRPDGELADEKANANAKIRIPEHRLEGSTRDASQIRGILVYENLCLFPVTMSVAQNNRVNLAYELALRHRPSHEPVVPGTQTRSNCKSLICDGFLVLLFVSN